MKTYFQAWLYRQRSQLSATSCTIACIVIASFVVAGCASVAPPARLFPVEEEIDYLRKDVTHETDVLKSLEKKEARRKRNEIVLARKYAIDLHYTKYETDLTREAQITDFGTKTANIALGTAGQLVPVAHTAKMLNGLALGVTSADAAYNEKLLRAQIIEHVQSAMRSGRHERAVVIYANMRCSLKTYPLAMALSDVESYYRAGTFSAGLVKLSRIVTEKEGESAAQADAQKPGDSDAQAKLAGMALEAGLKADAAMKKDAAPTLTMDVRGKGKIKVKGAHKCTLTDEPE